MILDKYIESMMKLMVAHGVGLPLVGLRLALDVHVD